MSGTQVQYLKKVISQAEAYVKHLEKQNYFLQADIAFTESVGCAFAWDLAQVGAERALENFEEALKSALAEVKAAEPAPAPLLVAP